MNKIESFKIDHTKLLPGFYISRIDGDVTTYDLRMKKPNGGDYLSNSQMHTFEHMFATFIRNSDIADDVIYFGPMGCQTGFYLLVRNTDKDTAIMRIKAVLADIIGYDGEVFGNSEIECGNYRTLQLSEAKTIAQEYLKELTAIGDR